MEKEKEKFKINVIWQGKSVELDCVIDYASAQIQRIIISKDKKSFTLQNNYPLVKAAPPNKRPPIQWKIIEGKPSDARFLTDVMSKLEDYIKDKKPFNWDEHPKNKPYFDT